MFGEIKICLLNSGVFVFVFTSEEIRTKVLEQGPWSFENKPVILKPWKPGVVLTNEGIESIPIWIRMPGLNLHFWSAHMLSKIASAVGIPLFTDRMTETMEIMAYARVCVEISAEQTLPKTVPVVGPDGKCVEITIIYEWTPYRCAKCKLFGHKDVTCRSKMEEEINDKGNDPMKTSADEPRLSSKESNGEEDNRVENEGVNKEDTTIEIQVFFTRK